LHWHRTYSTYVFEETVGFGIERWNKGRILAAGDDLEDDDAEAEHVGLGGEVAVHEVLGRHVPVGARDAGVHAGAAVARLRKEPGHSEVGDLGHPGGCCSP
jgi:hypothetical protein